jgi:hypothetical protein
VWGFSFESCFEEDSGFVVVLLVVLVVLVLVVPYVMSVTYDGRR